MSAQLLSMRILAGTLMMSLLVFCLALWFVLGVDTGTSAPPLWGVLVPVVAGVLALGLISVVGYRTPALAPGTPPEEGVSQGLAAFRTGQILRFALAEMPALVAIATGFIVEQGGYLVVLTGVGISLVLALLHVWPSDAQITRVQERLESSGARAPLLETLQGRAPTY